MSRVEGLDALRRRWGAIPGAVREAVSAEMEVIAAALVTDMQKLAPKGDTLALVESIRWTWGDAPKGSMVIGRVGRGEYGALRITIYAGGGDAFYARFHEYGTVKMAAQPFFFVVWRARRRWVRSRLTRAINRAIRAAVA